MTRSAVLLIAFTCAACGSSPSAPTAPTPTPTPTPAPPPVVSMIESSPCPPAIIIGFGVDLNFYRQIGCNAFDGPLFSVKRWTRAPKLYLFTVDTAGSPIDAVTLDTVERAMIAAAPMLTNGRIAIDTVERGSDPRREGLTGSVAVKWALTTDQADKCARSEVAIDGGWIELHPYVAGCSFSCGASKIRARTAAHELGHALGYYHTDATNDLMSGIGNPTCDAGLSAREQQAVAYHYR